MSAALGPEDAYHLKPFLEDHQTCGVCISSLAIDAAGGSSLSADLSLGLADADSALPMTPETVLEVASLSKTIAAAFALEYFAARKIPMTTRVNELLETAGAEFRLRPSRGARAAWAGEVTLAHLVDHTGLGMHYVNGIPRTRAMPAAEELVMGHHERELGYSAVEVHKKPGVEFGYSGGGFLVLQTLLEAMERKDIEEIMRPFLDSCGMRDFTFRQEDLPGFQYAQGYFDDGSKVPGGRLMFPALAAGGLGTTRSLANFWRHLLTAYSGRVHGYDLPISHSTAVQMLSTAMDKGSGNFMNARMGMGVFVAEAGPNRIGVHQAANEGFRGIYLVCFDGPDAGKGYIVCANGDNQSAICIAKIVQYLLLKSSWQGINHDLLRNRQDFDFSGIKQEEIVNFAYKTLVFDAFEAAVHSRL